MIAVSNSTPLIALAKGDSFSLLSSLFERVYIPQMVYEEVVVKGKGRAGSKETEHAKQSGWLVAKRVLDSEEAIRLADNKINTAETEAIILAFEVKPDFVLVDDLRARDVAKEYLKGTKIQIVHSTSLLMFAKDQGLLDFVKPTLDKMRRRGIWISNEDYRRILEAAKEI